MARKIKQYSEAELIKLFNLQRLVGNHAHPLLEEWLNCETELSSNDQYLFDIILKSNVQNCKKKNLYFLHSNK